MEDLMIPLSEARHRRDDPATAVLARATLLMEAMVAAYALVAHADGEVAAAERRRMFGILRENPLMSVFSREEIAEEIASHEANFRYDPELAQQIARERLVPIKGDRRAASQVVAACRQIIPADGIAHPAEYRALVAIKTALAFDDLTALRAAAGSAASGGRHEQ
jgi:tellurite resistance protein